MTNDFDLRNGVGVSAPRNAAYTHPQVFVLAIVTITPRIDSAPSNTPEVAATTRLRSLPTSGPRPVIHNHSIFSLVEKLTVRSYKES